jgi:hypothetical protein
MMGGYIQRITKKGGKMKNKLEKYIIVHKSGCVYTEKSSLGSYYRVEDVDAEIERLKEQLKNAVAYAKRAEDQLIYPRKKER